MTISTPPRTRPTTPAPQHPAPQHPAARTFLAGLAAQDFTALAGALDDDVHLTALVPSGLVDRHGPAEVSGAFARWFGGTEEFALADAEVAAVGTRLRLRWRLRLRASRLGEGWFVVEQQAYADASTEGAITRLSLVCSGFSHESRQALVTTGARS